MAPKPSNDDSSSFSSSSPSPPTKEAKKRSGKDSVAKDDEAPSPKSNDSDSSMSAPSAPPPESPQPPALPPPLKTPPPTPAQAPPPTPTPTPSPPPSSPAPSSPPPSSSPPPPLQNGNPSSSPPPTPYLHRAPPTPPPPQFQAPPSPSSSSSSPPSRGAPSNDSSPGTSGNSPTKAPLAPAPPTGFGQSMRGGGGGGGGDSSKSTDSSPSSSASDNAGKYVGYTLAGVFFVALVAVAIITFRRKKSKGDVYAAPHNAPPNLKFQIRPAGVDRLYYGQQPGVANGPQSPHGSNLGSGKNLGGSMKQLGAPLDVAQPASAQIAFSYDVIMETTDSFSSQNIIGEGGFGCVYKGLLPDGKAVAVKQLKVGGGQGEREFRAEVEIISRVHHRHLVSLVGYCISEQQRMLIYEYVPNGTLHHHLHGSEMPVLEWDKRLKIAIGAAKGLAYLHEDCGQKIIHRDIKSANILLDDAFEAQVADFGLARLTDTANTHVSTRVMGTFGYMAPEYATSGKLTDRSDVFSFGVVLLELVTGRKPVDDSQPLGDESLVEWARPLLLRAIESHDFSELIDPRLENHFVEGEMFRMIEAAAACVRHLAPKRPRMVQVVRALDCGDQISDLTNGVKYGHSTIYDSGQYDRDIMMFRRMANGSYGDSDFDMYSREYGSSREISGSHHAWMPSSSSGESECRALNKHRSSTG